jgi:hypothetical protein
MISKYLPNYYRLFLTLSLIFLQNFLMPILGNELKEKKDIEDLSKFEKQGIRFKNHLLETFDGNTPWEFYRSTSYLQDLYNTEDIPKSTNFEFEKNEFLQEFSKDEGKSLFLQSSIEVIEREKISISPKTTLELPFGIPKRLGIWVKSNAYKGNLFILFNKPNNKTERIKIGSLNYIGWKRHEIALPFKPPKGLNYIRKNKYEVTGLQIEFQKSQKKGVIVLQFDRLSILIDKIPRDYPGNEIEDGWGF